MARYTQHAWMDLDLALSELPVLLGDAVTKQFSRGAPESCVREPADEGSGKLEAVAS